MSLCRGGWGIVGVLMQGGIGDSGCPHAGGGGWGIVGVLMHGGIVDVLMQGIGDSGCPHAGDRG